jgi:hypothetical protein
MSLIDPNTNAGKITMILGDISWILSKMKARQISILVEKSEEILEFLSRISLTSIKEDISLKCLKDNAKYWGWTQEQQDTVGKKMLAVKTAKRIWSKPDAKLVDVDTSKFGEATITSEVFPFKLEDIDIAYRVLTEEDLFPNEDFVGMTVLEATRKFICLVDRLNQESIKSTGKVKYFFPGLETQHFFTYKIPDFMREGLWYHYVATGFRNHDGNLNVPCSDWNGSSLRRYGNYVGNVWYSLNRFLVLEII